MLSSLTDDYGAAYDVAGYLLVAVPGVVGLFWGAPLVTRELEAGTHRLVWNQSVTRGRWLAVKLGLVALVGMTLTGLYSLLLTWSAARVDLVTENRFQPLLFASRNIAPIGYAAFALALGTTAGLLLRRTVPAMAVTLTVFAVVQVLVPFAVRPYYASPVTATMPVTAQTIRDLSMIGHYGKIEGLTVPGGPWVVSTSPLLDAAGDEVGHTDWYQDCVSKGLDDIPGCLAEGDLHVEVTEHPADRYWTFQWYETFLFLALGALLAGLCFRRIQGPVG
ncbi:transporter [Streptomyces sp. NPDC057239]|uniref:transporter n=1 Tax=Streptomyces sp. NPDC057239 TaxID=3346061 RepID=UPI003639AF15